MAFLTGSLAIEYTYDESKQIMLLFLQLIVAFYLSKNQHEQIVARKTFPIQSLLLCFTSPIKVYEGNSILRIHVNFLTLICWKCVNKQIEINTYETRKCPAAKWCPCYSPQYFTDLWCLLNLLFSEEVSKTVLYGNIYFIV